MSNLGWNGLGEQLGLDLGTQQESVACGSVVAVIVLLLWGKS